MIGIQIIPLVFLLCSTIFGVDSFKPCEYDGKILRSSITECDKLVIISFHLVDRKSILEENFRIPFGVHFLEKKSRTFPE